MKTKCTMITLLLNQIEENTQSEQVKSLVEKGKTILAQLEEVEKNEESKKSQTSLKEIDQDEAEDMVESQIIEDQSNINKNLRINLMILNL